MNRYLCMLLLASQPFASALTHAPKPKNAEVALAYKHKLPIVTGNSIKGTRVQYGPGGYSPAHSHPNPADIYATVPEGAIRSRVDLSTMTYKAGQRFSELPGDRHGMGSNASKIMSARLLVVFVVNTNEMELARPLRM
jgi:quercetin dioxygenase-like cupin family protein